MPGANGWSSVDWRIRRRLKAEVLARDPVCTIGLDGCTKVSTELDNVRPRATAGDGLDNLRGACRSCNNRRGNPLKYTPDAKVAKWI